MTPTFPIQRSKFIWISFFLIMSLLFSNCSSKKTPSEPSTSTSPTHQVSSQKRWEEKKQKLDQLYESGKYKEGTALAEELYHFSKSEFGDRNPDTLTSMNDLGKFYISQGLYKKAEPLLQKTLTLRTEILGERHPKTLTTMDSLGELYFYQGFYDKVELLFRKALALRKEVLGETHPDTLESINNLGVLYKYQGRYDQAELLYQKSLALKKEVLGEKHPSTLGSINNLGLLYKSQGLYDQAEPLLQRSLVLSQEVLGEKHPETLKSINNVGVLYQSQGLYEKAEPLLQKVLALSQEVLGEKHPSTLRNMNNLGLLYKLQGLYDQAEPLYQKSLALNQEILGEKHPSTLRSMSNLGLLYKFQGLYKKAESLLQKSLVLSEEVLGKKHPSTLRTINNLGTLYELQGIYDKAGPLFQKSLALSQEVLGEKHPDTLISLSNLGALYNSQGLYDKAEPLLQKSLVLSQEALGEKHPDTLSNLNNLGTLYDGSQGLYDKAEPLYQKSLSLRREVLGEKHPDTLQSINNLSKLYLSQGFYEQAKPLLAQSLRQSNFFLEQVLWGASKNTRQSYLRQQESMRNVLLSFYHQNPNLDSAQEALYFSLTRKGLLLKVASEIKRLVRKQGSPQLQQLAEKLSDKKRRYAALIHLEQIKPQRNFQKRSKKLKEGIEELEAEMGRQVQSFQRAKQEVSPLQVVQALTKEQLLIDFLVFQEVGFESNQDQKERLMAVIVDSTQSPAIQIIDLGDLAPILEAIEQYRNQVYHFLDRQTSFQNQVQDLSRLLWHPFAPYLKGKKEIFLVPDGPLHLLPFGTLKNSEGKYLIEAYKLTMLSSSRDLVVDPLEGAVQDPIIVAAPDYSLDPSSYKKECETNSNRSTFQDLYFCPLPASQEEGKQVNQMMMGQASLHPTFYQGAEATEEAVAQVSSPKYLHLATHGYFLDGLSDKKEGLSRLILNHDSARRKSDFGGRGESEEDLLLRSGLAFAGANQVMQSEKLEEKADGILTALEILSLNLEGTELVVMSACDTGVGKIQQGEGVYSLQRAFQEAGAQAVLSTLWKVDSLGAQDFMQHFYKRLLQGTSPQESLRKTQLEFIRRGKYQNHPYFWAPFTLIGKDY